VLVGSTEWYVWLADELNKSFAFENQLGAVTVRRERKQRGGWYWVAYRQVQGKLHKVYLGRAEDVTSDRLIAAAYTLAQKSDQMALRSRSPRQQTVGDERRAPGASPLLVTKITPPPLRPDATPRPRLIARLAEGVRSPLTLVHAPAGFGKTTLLTAWAHDFGLAILDFGSTNPLPNPQSPIQNRKFAWLSLDVGDNDPARFWTYVGAALDRVCPNVSAGAQALLLSPRPLPIDTVLTTLINELNERTEVITLILDDYHVITTQEIHDSLTFLLNHLPPTLRIVIATREEPPLPLARLRARHQLTELSTDALAFTHEETAAFLYDTMGIQLTKSDIVALEIRTEGWAAGLQMAALALQGRDDASAFIAGLRGSHRSILDYLIGEVFDRQPAAVRWFLLRTAILDRLSGPLCDAVLKTHEQPVFSDTEAKDTSRVSCRVMLERLHRAGLFLLPLDDERRWYRYHQLFADALRERLSVAESKLAPELHRRAAVWFDANGDTAEAIRHALATQDSEFVADLIERAAPTMVAQRGEIVTLRSWLDMLPDHEIRKRPQLCVFRALVVLLSGQMQWAEIWLQYAETITSEVAREVGSGAEKVDRAPMRRSAAGEITAVRAMLSDMAGDAPRTITLAREALDVLPKEDILWRTGLPITLGRALQLTGDRAAARAAYNHAVKASYASQNYFAAIFGLCQLANVQMTEGRLRDVEATCNWALDLAQNAGLQHLPYTGYAHLYLGLLLYYRNDLAAAEQQLACAIACGQVGPQITVLRQAYFALAFVMHARHNIERAVECLREADDFTRPRYREQMVAQTAAYQARIALGQGHLGVAAEWAQTCGVNPDEDIHAGHEMRYVVLAQTLYAQGRLDDALRLLARLRRFAEVSGEQRLLVESMALEALTLCAGGESAQATQTLLQALELAEPEGDIRVFVDLGAPMADLLARIAQRRISGAAFARRLLAAFGDWKLEIGNNKGDTDQSPISNFQSLQMELLTPRELEVLRLLAAGCSNRDIAQRLVLAENTVKSYTKRLYAKLDVASRTQAIARGRELNLL
jgi:LuxR family maltose regulon positive regulatory protein